MRERTPGCPRYSGGMPARKGALQPLPAADQEVAAAETEDVVATTRLHNRPRQPRKAGAAPGRGPPPSPGPTRSSRALPVARRARRASSSGRRSPARRLAVEQPAAGEKEGRAGRARGRRMRASLPRAIECKYGQRDQRSAQHRRREPRRQVTSAAPSPKARASQVTGGTQVFGCPPRPAGRYAFYANYVFSASQRCPRRTGRASQVRGPFGARLLYEPSRRILRTRRSVGARPGATSIPTRSAAKATIVTGTGRTG